MWVVSLTTRAALSAGKASPISNKEIGWASEELWTFRCSENSLPLRGIEPRFVYCTARTLAIVLAKSSVNAYVQTLIFSLCCNNSSLLLSAIKSLGTSSSLCYKQLGRGWGMSKHNCLVSYLLCWRQHVSATVGHLQVTKMYIEENYTDCDHSRDLVESLEYAPLLWSYSV